MVGPFEETIKRIPRSGYDDHGCPWVAGAGDVVILVSGCNLTTVTMTAE